MSITKSYLLPGRAGDQIIPVSIATSLRWMCVENKPSRVFSEKKLQRGKSASEEQLTSLCWCPKEAQPSGVRLGEVLPMKVPVGTWSPPRSTSRPPAVAPPTRFAAPRCVFHPAWCPQKSAGFTPATRSLPPHPYAHTPRLTQTPLNEQTCSCSRRSGLKMMFYKIFRRP